MSARGGGGSLISVSAEIREKGNRCLRAFPKKIIIINIKKV
jgi:hypothetical protein